MKKELAIKKAGTPSNLAKILGVTRQSVNSWGEFLPEARVWQLKVIHPEWFKESAEKAKETA